MMEATWRSCGQLFTATDVTGSLEVGGVWITASTESQVERHSSPCSTPAFSATASSGIAPRPAGTDPTESPAADTTTTTSSPTWASFPGSIGGGLGGSGGPSDGGRGGGGSGQLSGRGCPSNDGTSGGGSSQKAAAPVRRLRPHAVRQEVPRSAARTTPPASYSTESAEV